MITTFPLHIKAREAHAQQRRAQIGWWFWYAFLISITGYVGLLLLRQGSHPAPLGWFCYVAGAIAILYRPRYGVYLTVGFALVGDSSLIWWYPFVKNFSSSESLLFLSDSLIISPAETYVALTYIAWLGRGIVQRKLTFHTGTLFWPALIFIAFISFGLVYGILRGGNLTIGLWECRPIFYLPAMLVLTSNLIETRKHVNCLIWVAMLALFIEAIHGTWYVATVLKFQLSTVERIAEHSLSIHENSFIVLVIVAWMYRASNAKRFVLPVMLPFVLLTNLANQRRAGYITLVIALVVIAVMLYWENRKAFWMIVPAAGLIGLMYLGVFWNSSGALGLPASAIKSVIASDTSGADHASNLYRIIENINTAFTIKNAPLTGVGFGNKFFIIVPMPDISFFEWWEYITHNSILWIWMKAGFGSFFSMIFLIGLSLMVGMRTVQRMPGGDMSAAALTATLYILMHFIYAYVDMSWDNQSMIYVGTMMGLINGLERIVSSPIPVPQKRWPWQPDPDPAPGLRPL